MGGRVLNDLHEAEGEACCRWRVREHAAHPAA